MSAGRVTLVRYRVDRAREALQEAALLLGAGHTTAAVNRQCYACFYAVSALLLTEGRSARFQESLLEERSRLAEECSARITVPCSGRR